MKQWKTVKKRKIKLKKRKQTKRSIGGNRFLERRNIFDKTLFYKGQRFQKFFPNTHDFIEEVEKYNKKDLEEAKKIPTVLYQVKIDIQFRAHAATVDKLPGEPTELRR